MYLYNSATRKKELFVPNNPDIVKMYTCGPTVYHFAHIGNLRSYIMEDVLEKALRYEGYNVKRVMNITDVGHLSSDADTGEDKMLKGARREHKSVMEIAAYYTDAFFDDCKKLNIKRPDVVEPATNCIDEYIKIVSALIEKGYAYLAGGNVYFDTSKLERYYIFNEHNEEDLAVGVREGVEEYTNKRNKNDFVLWFTKSKFEDQALKWESPWGVGYPGWHIECSGISMKHLGEDLDIHCGGIDNAFPHHTNEIAQSESYLGHKWCNFWFHVLHLNTNSGKMSKSSGEFLTVSLLESKGYDPLVYRLFCLQSHYRKNLVFTYENLDNAAKTYGKLIGRIAALDFDDKTPVDEAALAALKEKFKKAGLRLCAVPGSDREGQGPEGEGGRHGEDRGRDRHRGRGRSRDRRHRQGARRGQEGQQLAGGRPHPRRAQGPGHRGHRYGPGRQVEENLIISPEATP